MATEPQERLGVTFGSQAKSGLLNPKAASGKCRGSVAEQEKEHEMKANCSDGHVSLKQPTARTDGPPWLPSVQTLQCLGNQTSRVVERFLYT